MRILRLVPVVAVRMRLVRRIGLSAASALLMAMFVSAWPAQAATFTEYTVPTSGSYPYGITAGPDGALWFTEYFGNKVGRVTTSGNFTEFAIPTPNAEAIAITAGPDGALWFAEQFGGGGKVGRITAGGSFTEFSVPTSGSGPYAITTGPDGALWLAIRYGNKIDRVTTSGSFSEYPVPTPNSEPRGITAGPDGALWFTEAVGNKVGRLTIGGAFAEFAIPTAGSDPYGITAGPDGALWFAEQHTGIGRITTGGSISEFAVPTVNSNPLQITAGPDGALWFTEGAGKIGRITTGGSVSEVTVPTPNNLPVGITAGADGAIWFTDATGNKIWRLGPSVGPPANLTLAPKTQIKAVNTQACLTATVTDKNGTPTPSVNVVFSVTTAAVTQASPSSGTVTTNSSGQATFCYSAHVAGQDAVHAFADPDKNGVQESGEPSDDASVTWFAFATSNGATFVIGDLAPTGNSPAVPGDTVTWWSSQWATLNPMTGGPPPTSMKGFAGFEDMPATPNCGNNWTTDPGNSTPPPTTVPDYMGVIVSSHVAQNGSVISGDIKHIVIVKNNHGYAPNPGSTGTGTVLSYLC